MFLTIRPGRLAARFALHVCGLPAAQHGEAIAVLPTRVFAVDASRQRVGKIYSAVSLASHMIRAGRSSGHASCIKPRMMPVYKFNCERHGSFVKTEPKNRFVVRCAMCNRVAPRTSEEPIDLNSKRPIRPLEIRH